ncbi:MAG: hypothetical protein ACRDRL_32820, partial [Sciscionella sp.]
HDRGARLGKRANPLYAVPYTELHALARAVSPTEPEAAAVLDELLVAGQCDLLLHEMLAGTADFAELPAISAASRRGLIGRELLTWAFSGTAPGRYRYLFRADCLYPRTDRQRLAEIGGELQLSSIDKGLASYADAHLALMTPSKRDGSAAGT